jgi:hypothetical protein
MSPSPRTRGEEFCAVDHGALALVGVKFFLISAALWMRGILEHEYGVPFKSIKWFTELDEELFPDYKTEEMAYYKKTGVFPIMHTLGIKQEIVERYPWVPINMFQALNESKAIAMQRMENPRIVPLVWYREAWEEQEGMFGPDPWQYGLTERKLKTLETLVGYSYEQGLIKRKIPMDELFLSVSQGGPAAAMNLRFSRVRRRKETFRRPGALVQNALRAAGCRRPRPEPRWCSAVRLRST